MKIDNTADTLNAATAHCGTRLERMDKAQYDIKHVLHTHTHAKIFENQKAKH